MKILIILEYDYIDANSEEADRIVNEVSQLCYPMQVAFDAHSCYIEEIYNEDDFILEQTGKVIP